MHLFRHNPDLKRPTFYLNHKNQKLGNQAHQKIQLNVPNWNGTKLDNIDTIDAKMSFYLDLEN